MAAIAVGAIAVLAVASTRPAPRERSSELRSETGESGTSRQELERVTARLEAEVGAHPGNGEAASQLADLLLRRARTESNGGYTALAERVLTGVLDDAPSDYLALRMLGAVRLSQHRFRQAIELAERASRVRPTDAFNYGVLGDAHLELGEYEQAFQAFDRMVSLRPGAPAYARVAYAGELQGRLGDAIDAMQMALSATSARDAESIAWHHAQLGNLYLQSARWDEAAREFAHAEFSFPGHPYARLGQARLAAAAGKTPAAVAIYREILAERPTMDAARELAVLLQGSGQAQEAETLFARAEALERESWLSETPQPAGLARILLDRGTRLDEAVALAERAAASRADIFTMDTLAWAYYQTGRLDDAERASRQARRTGSLDRRIVEHAKVIDAARAGS
jgi:tetratricopeptide (TPR) repeat protein